MDSTAKANSVGFSASNRISEVGDTAAAIKNVLNEVPVTITESEVTVVNEEIGIAKYNKPTSRLFLAISKAVDYLKVRIN